MPRIARIADFNKLITLSPFEINPKKRNSKSVSKKKEIENLTAAPSKK